MICISSFVSFFGTGIVQTLLHTFVGGKHFLRRRRLATLGSVSFRSAAILLLMAGLATAQGKKSFTGKITDSMCATTDHAHMGMGPTDRECTIACVMAHGALYVL